jgi:hypothetical protein
MIFVTTYKLKPFMSKSETRELMKVFAQAGVAPGVKAHYVAADGSHGVVISDDDPAVGYRSILNYTQWIEYHTTVMLTVEQAVPLIMASLA